MHDGLDKILLQVLRTGLIAGSLGLLIYAALMFGAGFPRAKWGISLVISGPMAALIGFEVARAWRTGIFPSLGGAIVKAQQPLSYWCLIVTFITCGVLLGALAIWSAWQLLSGP